jgi:Uma2 family endonuclease
MEIQQIAPAADQTESILLPPLQSGDRLSRYEFERRYQAMGHLKKAELIEGIVYMPSPVSVDHSESRAFIIGWLAAYSAATPGIRLNDNATVRLDLDNEVQPDALLRLDPVLGGNCRVSADRYLEGAPELVVEIAVSSAAYDLHDKLKVYRRNGVKEYLIWQIYDKRLDWFRLDDKGEYALVEADEAGIMRSQVFPGLHLNVTALLKGDLAGVLAELQKGLNTTAHQAFAEQLAKK